VSSTRYLPIAAEGHNYHFFDRGREKYVFGPIFIIFTKFTILRIFTNVYQHPYAQNMYAGPQTNCLLLCSHTLVLPLLFFDIQYIYILFLSRSISLLNIWLRSGTFTNLLTMTTISMMASAFVKQFEHDEH
jgi:hypothetical protein